MNRIVLAAHDLRRRVYASLPWGWRLGNLLTKLASDSSSAFGQVAYGLFLLHGVTDMPAIKGEPAENSKPEKPAEIDRKIPRGYGKDFGQKTYRVLLRRFKSPDFAEEVMSEGIIKILTGDSYIARELNGKSLAKAENLFIKTMVNLGIDIERRRGRERSMVDHEGEDIPFEDPNAWRLLEEKLPEKEISEIKRELSAIVDPRLAPDLALYFDLLLDGYKDSEILRNKMLPFLKEWGEYEHKQHANWSKNYKEKIKVVLRNHFDVN